jgi:hypothetical protein
VRSCPRCFKIKINVNIFFIKKYAVYKLTTHLLLDTLFFPFYLIIFGGSDYFGNLNYYGNSRNFFAIFSILNDNTTFFLQFF